MENEQGQTSKNVVQNIAFFRDNIESYSENIYSLDTYVMLRKYINNAISGVNTLLDVGNGGIFDYDTSLASNIIGLDLFLDQLPGNYKYPPNVEMKKGDALNIPYENDTFDGVLMVMLIHHLVGKNVKSCYTNMRKAISEARRVLKPGGKLIIAESCVPSWFYLFEKSVFYVASKFIDKFFKHPSAFQYTEKILIDTLLDIFSDNDVKVENIPIGRWVLQFGVKFPTALTPVKPKIFTVNKSYG